MKSPQHFCVDLGYNPVALVRMLGAGAPEMLLGALTNGEVVSDG
jgi:hypothetical protein